MDHRDHSALELRDRHWRLWPLAVGVEGLWSGLAVWTGVVGLVSSDADGQVGEAHDTRAGSRGSTALVRVTWATWE